MLHGHGGNIYAMARQLDCRPEEIIDMSSNINPLGMPPGLEAYLKDRVDRAGRLPEVDSRTAIRQMAALLDVEERRLLAGMGTTQFIYTACSALNARKVLIVGPTYADYADACRMHRIEPRYFLTHHRTRFEIDLQRLDEALIGYDVVFICNPNNPTGRLIPHDELAGLCRAHPETRFIVDESYMPFVPADQSQSMIHPALENVSVLWSLSKIFGIPGLRAGFLIANEATVASFQRYMQPWSLGGMAQAAVEFLGCNPKAAHDFMDKTRRFLAEERTLFHDERFTRTRLTVFPSRVSYVLIGLPDGMRADEVCSHMAEKRILIRNCGNFRGLSEQYVRVALKDAHINRLALNHLIHICSSNKR